MEYKINVSSDAHRDALDISGYIAFDLGNIQAAGRFLDDVHKAYLNLSNNPHMYAECNEERLKAKGYRKLAIKRYLIFYRVDESTKTVFIARVLYGARDYANLL